MLDPSRRDWPRIPEIQRRMHLLVDEMLMPSMLPMSSEEIALEFRNLIVKLSRRPRKTNAPVASRKMSPEIADQILEFHRRFPEATQQEIAVAFGVTAGRISETIAGKRK